MQSSDKAAPLKTRLARQLAASGAVSLSDPKLALYLDANDPLQHLRSRFSFPKRRTVWPEEHRAEMERRGEADRDEDAAECVYLAGNSLGLMPRDTPALLQEELAVWSAS